MGDLYQIPLLCKFAVLSFNGQVSRQQWPETDLKDFCESAKLALTSTPVSNTGMREAVAAVIASQGNQMLASDTFVKSLREDFPEIGAEVLIILMNTRAPRKHPCGHSNHCSCKMEVSFCQWCADFAGV